MADNMLDFKTRDYINELVQLIHLSKERGGFFLVGVSGPLAQKIIEDELSNRLKEVFLLKKVSWSHTIKDLSELFPLEDTVDTVYIVDDLEKTPPANKNAVFSLLNLTREFYTRYKKIVIYCMSPGFLYKELQWKVADFWSFRLASFDFFLPGDYEAATKEKINTDLEGYEKDSTRLILMENLLALEKKKKEPDPGVISNILSNLGTLYHNIGETEKALAYFTEALKIQKKSGNKLEEARQLGNIGTVHISLGQSQEALGILREALTLARQLGDKQVEANQLGHIGLVYRDLGQLQEALKYHGEALKLYRQLGDKQGEAIQMGNFGLIYRDLDQRQEAVQYYRESLELSRQLGDKQGEARQLGNIGLIYRDLGQHQEALKFHLEALELSRQLGYKQGEANNLGNIGLIYKDLGQPQEALKYLQNALEFFKKNGDKNTEGIILKAIHDIQNQ